MTGRVFRGFRVVKYGSQAEGERYDPTFDRYWYSGQIRSLLAYLLHWFRESD